MPIKLSDKAKEAASIVSKAAKSDIILFNAPAGRETHERLLRLLDRRKRQPSVLLILVSEGGNADAAYKISRSLQAIYEKFTCALPGYSKSAATVILTGAHDLVIGDDGELGPLDVQMSKKDTLAEYESGLTVLNALSALHEKAYLAWEHFFLQIEESSSGSITVTTASHAASELTTGLFAPVYGQIDPLQVGEASRAMAIGHEYAKRLNRVTQNLRPGALDRLVSGYPDHGFVIDRTEAKTLFYRVRQPTTEELVLFQQLEGCCEVENGRKPGLIDYLNEEESIEIHKGENNASPAAQPAAQGNGHDASVPATGTNASAD